MKQVRLNSVTPCRISHFSSKLQAQLLNCEVPFSTSTSQFPPAPFPVSSLTKKAFPFSLPWQMLKPFSIAADINVCSWAVRPMPTAGAVVWGRQRAAAWAGMRERQQHQSGTSALTFCQQAHQVPPEEQAAQPEGQVQLVAMMAFQLPLARELSLRTEEMQRALRAGSFSQRMQALKMACRRSSLVAPAMLWPSAARGEGETRTGRASRGKAAAAESSSKQSSGLNMQQLARSAPWLLLKGLLPLKLSPRTTPLTLIPLDLSSS